MSKRIVTAAVLLVLAAPALAGHCPKDVKAIDAALEDAKLDDDVMAEVQDLRDEGEDLHNAGQHEESLEVLHEAMKILKLEH